MIAGRTYIDTLDLFTTYSAYVVSGYDDLAAFPPLKSVKSNDWQEEDGLEADLSDPCLDTYEVSLKFVCRGGYAKMNALITAITTGAYHAFQFNEIGRSVRLRYVSSSDVEVVDSLCWVVVKFADDFPLSLYTYAAPVSSVPSRNDYLMDGVKFTNYGVRILLGSRAEIEKPAEVKQNLLRNLSVQSGVQYDGQNVTFKAKDVRLSCYMRAASLTEFWKNRDALLYQLTQPGEHILKVTETGKEYPFYYKSCQTTEFIPTGKVWFKFTLTLCFV